MRYKVQFCKGWVGTWIFDAPNDIRAWVTALDYIHSHTQVVTVGIEAIFEIDNEDKQLRQLPNKDDCEETPAKKREQNQKQEEKAIYKVHFSDGKCSGPYVAKVTENDTAALEIAGLKLKQHAEYNKLDFKTLKITKVEELNEDFNFTVNVERKQNNKRLKNPKPEKKNRLLQV